MTTSYSRHTLSSRMRPPDRSVSDETEASGRAAIDALHAGPLADFIRSRDALAKALRANGDREAASAVKALRKPSRPAWALNRIVHQEPDRLAMLDAAVAGIVDAHAGRGDVRAAMATLREAVRTFAGLAAAESPNDTGGLDVGVLSNAILAVLASPTSYDEFRNGRITEIPEAGGLDFLASLPVRAKLEVSSAGTAARPRVDPAEAAAAREQAERAAAALASARTAADAAATALAESDTEVATAQENVRIADAVLKAAQQRREFARRTHESAAAELRTAEAASREAEGRPGSLSEE
jgi:hypothetical protein